MLFTSEFGHTFLTSATDGYISTGFAGAAGGPVVGAIGVVVPGAAGVGAAGVVGLAGVLAALVMVVGFKKQNRPSAKRSDFADHVQNI